MQSPVHNDSLTLDPTGGVLAGGSIVVDGVPYIVPQNLLATLPAIAVAWSEWFFKNGTANLQEVSHGKQMSLGTVLRGNISVASYTSLKGNRSWRLIFHMLLLTTQRAVQLLQGSITSIDIATGHFHIGVGVGIECVLNDPTGRYGKPYLDHPLFQSDPDNPSIHATSGFPVCITRSQNYPLCLGKN